MKLKRIEREFSVCRIPDLSEVDFQDAFCFVGKTDEELSLVCPTEKVPARTLARADGWGMFRIEGVLEFSLVGVLAGISAVLAAHQIGIFAVSTYNTDYVLTRQEDYENALSTLEQAGYQIVR